MEENKKDIKNLDKKNRGVGKFFGIVKEHFFQLLALNLIFIVTSIPIITIGPAWKALSKTTMDMVRGRTYSPLKDYFLEFKRNFLTAALAGCAFTTLIAAMVYSVVITLSTPNQETGFVILAVIVLITLIYIIATIMYALNLLPTVEIETKQVWKNAVLLVFLSPKQMILLMLFVLLPGCAFALYFEIGLFLYVLGYFSFASLIASFNAWTVINKYVVRKEEAEDNTVG